MRIAPLPDSFTHCRVWCAQIILEEAAVRYSQTYSQ